MRCYLAHPISDYGGSLRQLGAIAQVRQRGYEVISPDAPQHEAGYKQRGMEYFFDMVSDCDALAFLRFPDGTIGKGVAGEIERALFLNLPVFDLDRGTQIMSLFGQAVLSVSQTRSKLKGIGRVLAWFSCGDASAAAAKLSIERHGDRCEVVYCDTFAFEHPDNRRFFNEVQDWLGREIKIIGSQEFMDIYQVFDVTGWLVGPGGARCTTELKKVPRRDYQRHDDLHVFGFTLEEQSRIDKFFRENPIEFAEFPLWENRLSKADCHAMIQKAGIELPAMYKLGYKNNNCIGCVKGGMGYWNKIRRDFPEAFDRMARQERKMGATILSDRKDGERKRLYLDELDPKAGRYISEPDIECGVLCTSGEDE